MLGLFIAVTAIWNPTMLMPFMRERRVEVRPSRLGAWAPPVMGVAFGFGWTPCIGPTLASILTIAAVQDTVAEGMILWLFYGLGLGVPFVLFAIGIDGCTERSPGSASTSSRSRSSPVCCSPSSAC